MYLYPLYCVVYPLHLFPSKYNVLYILFISCHLLLSSSFTTSHLAVIFSAILSLPLNFTFKRFFSSPGFLAYKGHLISKLDSKMVLVLPSLHPSVIFNLIFYLPQFTLLYFHFISSQATLPNLSCHRTSVVVNTYDINIVMHR